MEEKLEVMLIDDEEIVCKRLKSALEKQGYTVEIFLSGESAIERLMDKQYDVVVTDIRMGEADGLDVLEAVKKYSTRTRTIIITGYATSEVAREAQAKGAFDFLAKPFRPKDLCKMIEKAARELEKGGG